jgi:hypothetical protein
MPTPLSRVTRYAALWLAAIVFLGSASSAEAVIFGGGGSSKTDCLLVLDTPINDPIDKPKRIRCTDGDPACDADATVNGTCVFPTAVCANSSYNLADCTLVGLDTAVIDHSADNGDKKFDPEYQALQSRIDNEVELPNLDPDDCSGFTNISVDVKGPFPGKACRRGKKKMKVRSQSTSMAGKRFKDNDTLKMFCEPAPLMCDAQTFFTGTFDRIQNQVFDNSCALGGCHDSEGFEGSLLLESGTSYGAIVDVDPANATAFVAGFKRIATTGPATGDPDTSFLMLKIEGNLDSGMGERMPLESRKISKGFREIIELWILAGAPEMGWVPGTDQ